MWNYRTRMTAEFWQGFALAIIVCSIAALVGGWLGFMMDRMMDAVRQ